MDSVFIWYCVNSKACQFSFQKYDDTDIHVNIIIETNNVEFFEHIYPYKTECESTSEIPKPPKKEQTKNTLPSEDPRHSTRQQKPTSFKPDFVVLFLKNEPQTFKVAMSSSESTYWKEVYNSEI